MFKQIEKLQQDASRFVWPAIATLAVIAGGGAAHEAAQAEEAEHRVSLVANLAGLVGVAVGAAHAKGKNQSRRDQKLGIRDESGYPRINADNFGVATKRYKDLGRQSTALTFAPGVVIATAGATAAATAAFAPVAAVIGCIVAPTCMGFAAELRKVGLEYDLRDAASKILENSQSNPANVLKEARSFLANLRQL